MVYIMLVMVYTMVYIYGIYHDIYHLPLWYIPWYIPKVVYTTFGVVYTMRQPSRCGDPGTAESIAALTNLTFNKHIIYYMMYDTISCNIINMSNQNNVLHTSGAMRSRSRKGKVRSKILTLSPVMCLPVCLSTYMSMKCVAYAEVTSTMVKEESN